MSLAESKHCLGWTGSADGCTISRTRYLLDFWRKCRYRSSGKCVLNYSCGLGAARSIPEWAT